MQKVIILPGLGDHVRYIKWATRNWSQVGLEPIIHPMYWYDGKDFKTKLDEVISLVDDLSKTSELSVVGCSAGGSAALNVFAARPNKIKRAVSICGRLKIGNKIGFRSLEARAVKSPAFAESVTFFEKQEKNLTENQRKRIVTIRARFGDELVPSDTASLEGGRNILVPTPEHSLSIYASLKFLKSLKAFLKEAPVPI